MKRVKQSSEQNSFTGSSRTRRRRHKPPFLAPSGAFLRFCNISSTSLQHFEHIEITLTVLHVFLQAPGESLPGESPSYSFLYIYFCIGSEAKSPPPPGPPRRKCATPTPGGTQETHKGRQRDYDMPAMYERHARNNIVDITVTLWYTPYTPNHNPRLPVMPLLQSRVVAIINAALDYKQALDEFAGLISDLAAQSHSPNPPDRIELLETIHAAAKGYKDNLKEPFNSPHVLITEYEYFSKNAARNAHNAELMRQKRAGSSGAPRRQRAPVYAAYQLAPINTPAEFRGNTAPNPQHNYPKPSLLTTDESAIPEFAKRGAEEYHARERERAAIKAALEHTEATIKAAEARGTLTESLKRDIEDDAESLRRDIEDQGRDIFAEDDPK